MAEIPWKDIHLCAHKLGEMIRIPTVSKAEHEDLTVFSSFLWIWGKLTSRTL